MALPIIPTHDEVIKAKMQQLANVTTQAVNRITPQILSAAANLLRESIGSTNYDEYILNLNLLLAYDDESLGNDASVLYSLFDAKTFDSLTDEEKSLRNLIYAEAYLGLYYLAIALKKLVKGNTMTDRENTNSVGITAASFGDIIDNMELYKEQANALIESSGDGDYLGGLGVFVV